MAECARSRRPPWRLGNLHSQIGALASMPKISSLHHKKQKLIHFLESLVYWMSLKRLINKVARGNAFASHSACPMRFIFSHQHRLVICTVRNAGNWRRRFAGPNRNRVPLCMHFVFLQYPPWMLQCMSSRRMISGTPQSGQRYAQRSDGHRCPSSFHAEQQFETAHDGKF